MSFAIAISAMCLIWFIAGMGIGAALVHRSYARKAIDLGFSKKELDKMYKELKSQWDQDDVAHVSHYRVQQ